MNAPRRRLFARLALLFCALGDAACQYDIDKIYKHQPIEKPDEVPAHLIDLWTDEQLSEECKTCARRECAVENTTCRDDPQCLAFTTCVAKADNPAAQNDCRAEHTAWLREEITLRDVGGPYHTCVFLNECATPCDSRKQLSCTRDFDWPLVSDTSVGLHLRLVDGLASNKPAAGVRVRACQSENALSCLPLSDWVTSDEDGVVDLDVRLQLGQFHGYLELEGGGLYPTLLRFGWPIAREMTTNITVVDNGTATLLVEGVLPPVPTPASVTKERGFLQTRMFGCTGIPGKDVSFQCDGADQYTQDWYTVGQEPYPNFDVRVTGDRGAGGIINVVPGRRLITTLHEGEVISKFSAPVRAGYMTILFIFPGDNSMLSQ